MEITVEEIGMVRENYNPTNTNLKLDVDWAVEYANTDQNCIQYDIVLKSEEYLNLNFKLCGLVKLGAFEEFVQEECSQILFNHACSILMNMISLTRQSEYEILREDMGSAVNFNAVF